MPVRDDDNGGSDLGPGLLALAAIRTATERADAVLAGQSPYGQGLAAAEDDAAARALLKLVVGTDVQAYSTLLKALADLPVTPNAALFLNADGAPDLATLTTFAQDVLGAANASALRQAAGLVIGTDVQGFDGDLKLIADGGTTAFGRALLLLSDPTGARTALGAVSAADVTAAIAQIIGSAPSTLDTLAEIDAALNNDPNFASTVMSALAGKAALSHIHAVADLSDASANAKSLLQAPNYAAMRTLLGLVVGTNVQAYDADLDAVAANGTSTLGLTLLAIANAAAARRAVGVEDASGYLVGDGRNLTNLPASQGLTKATQPQAQGGTDDAVYMTPLRTADAIAALGFPATTAAYLGQDVRALYLILSGQTGADRLNGVATIADSFNDQSDVGTVTGATYDATNKRYGPTPTATTKVSTPAQAISGGDLGSTPSKGNAFDGDTGTSWASAQQGSATTNAAYIGQDFGAGGAKTIASVTIANSPNAGYQVASIAVQWSDDNAAWTTVATHTPSQAASATATIAVPGSTPHRYWRLLATGAAGASTAWVMTEVGFFTATAATPSYTLTSVAFPGGPVANPTRARVAVQIDAVSEAFTLNTDLIASVSRTGGGAFTAGVLSLVTTLADGSAIYETDLIDLSGQAAGSSMMWQVRRLNGKSIFVTGAVLQWRP